MTVAAIGEGMVELTRRADGAMALGFGGDTLNTAVYLARLGAAADYVTALGDDPYSEAMLAAWAAEGVGTGRVLRLAGRMPGLYAIETDAGGERRFYYWRDSAAARDLFALPETDRIAAALSTYDLIYLSGITLSLYGEAGRATLLAALDAARAGPRRTKVAFDTNFRPRNWPDPAAARAAFAAMLARTDIALPGADDMAALFGDRDPAACLDRLRAAGAAEIALKLTPPGCLVACDGREETVAAEAVAEIVDTTAAGDSFNAAYLAARLAGAAPPLAARRGHRLAARVVRHRGAIIPRAAMADLIA
jgi:2-dehydro-3-deoxygluconokinase